jgi:excisionase family DNA binding protein
MDNSESHDRLTVPEAAAFLRLKQSTIRAWVLKHKLIYLKLGGRVFLRRRDLQELLEKCVVPATASVDLFKTGGTSPPVGAVEPSSLTTQPTRGGAQ